MITGVGPKILPAGTLIGSKIKNHYEEDLGRIKDIMLDLEYGTIAYVIISYGGVLGIGEKLFVVPFQALKAHTEDQTFHLNVKKDKFENAPEYKTKNPNENINYEFLTDVYNYYGHEIYWLEPKER
ncbi:MAG: PRC-barrel domain-containing protein [Cytophagaceae bacterium]